MAKTASENFSGGLLIGGCVSMKVNSPFDGIFEKEIEPILAAVRSHRRLSEVEAMPCPACGAKISVHFSREGRDFNVYCAGEQLHFSRYEEITNPPAWWKERIEDSRPVTFYWRADSRFVENGTLNMPASGYLEDGSHWNGAMTVPSDHADYRLWQWIIAQGDRFKPLISDNDLTAIRELFAATMTNTK
jgi:hypothetical protein